MKFIVGSRQVKAPRDLANHFHWNGDAISDGQLIDTITPRHGNTKTETKRRRREPIWTSEEQPGHWRAVWACSKKRTTRDEHTLTAQENRARAVNDGDAAVKSTRFVKTTAAGGTLDNASLERARRLVGLKGYVTNNPSSIMPPAEMLSNYHDLWNAEQSFRMSKSDLRARPVFHRQRETIEARFTIVFTALVVARFMHNETGLNL